MANKISLDNKRRGSFGSAFRPGDCFLREVRGSTVLFRKLEPTEPPLVKARKIKGKWVGAAIKLPRKAIVEAIREDRESQ
jgi:hypothetical protein